MHGDTSTKFVSAWEAEEYNGFDISLRVVNLPGYVKAMHSNYTWISFHLKITANFDVA